MTTKIDYSKPVTQIRYDKSKLTRNEAVKLIGMWEKEAARLAGKENRDVNVHGGFMVGDVVEIEETGEWGSVVSLSRDGMAFVCVTKKMKTSTQWYSLDELEIKRYFGANEAYQRNIGALEDKIKHLESYSDMDQSTIDEMRTVRSNLQKTNAELMAQLEDYRNHNAALTRTVAKQAMRIEGESE